MKELYQQLGISDKVFEYGKQIEEKLKNRFDQIDQTAEYNQLKVIKALQSHGDSTSEPAPAHGSRK